MAPIAKYAAAVAGAVLIGGTEAQDKFEMPVATKDTFAPEPVYKETKSHFVEVPPIAVCPDGSFSTAGCASIETSDATYSCPHPYKMDKGSNLCVATTFAKPSISCPKGSVEHKNKCLTTETAPLEYVCPKKTIETKEGCVVPAGEGTPDRELEPKLVCPKGSKLDGDQCISLDKIEGNLVCDKGFELYKKKCVSRVSVPMECKEGELHGDKCIVVETVPSSVVCPKNANYEGKGCATVETFPPSAVCDKGYVLTGKFCIRKVVVTASYDNNMKKDGNPDFKCAYKTDEHGNCYYEEKTKPDPVCPKGADLKGKKCVTVEILSPEYGCPKKFEESGKKGDCMRTTEYKAYCPKGYKKADGACWKNIAESPAFVCPPGTDESKKGCTKLSAVPAAAVCPKKAQMDKSGRCIIPGKEGKAGKTLAPKAYCPKGYHQMTDGCVRDASSAGDYVCDKGYELRKKKCVAEHTIQPIMMCPKGYISVQGGKCTRTSYDPPAFVCPEGAVGKGKKCYQEATDYKMPAPVKVTVPSPLKKIGTYNVDEAAIEEDIDSQFADIETYSVSELGSEDLYSAAYDDYDYYETEAGEL